MSRSISATALRNIYASEMGDYPVLLITISAANLVTPIRISSDPTQRILETEEAIIYGTVSNGENYLFMPFSINLPSDEEGSSPRASISIDNVSRDLVPTIRTLTAPPQVTIAIVMASTPNVTEASFPCFDITGISYDSMTITGSLTVESMVSEPFPSGMFTPPQFPGLF